MFLRNIKNIHAHVLLSLTMLDITYYHINNDTRIIISIIHMLLMMTHMLLIIMRIFIESLMYHFRCGAQLGIKVNINENQKIFASISSCDYASKMMRMYPNNIFDKCFCAVSKIFTRMYYYH